MLHVIKCVAVTIAQIKMIKVAVKVQNLWSASAMNPTNPYRFYRIDFIAKTHLAYIQH